jgi:hypothetical protein
LGRCSRGPDLGVHSYMRHRVLGCGLLGTYCGRHHTSRGLRHSWFKFSGTAFVTVLRNRIPPAGAPSRTSTSPTRTVDAHTHREKPVSQTIVVGVDGSETAAQAARTAAELAFALGAKLHVLSAFDKFESETFTSGEEEIFFTTAKKAERTATSVMTELRATSLLSRSPRSPPRASPPRLHSCSTPTSSSSATGGCRASPGCWVASPERSLPTRRAMSTSPTPTSADPPTIRRSSSRRIEIRDHRRWSRREERSSGARKMWLHLHLSAPQLSHGGVAGNATRPGSEDPGLVIVVVGTGFEPVTSGRA